MTIIGSLSVAGCTSTGHRSAKATSQTPDEALPAAAPSSGTNGSQQAAQPSTATTSAKPAAASADKEQRFANECRKTIHNLAASYTALRQIAATTTAPTGKISALLALKDEDCANRQKRPQLLRTLVGVLDDHAEKIGFIAPLTGRAAALGAALETGIRAAYAEKQRSFTEAAVVKDSRSNPSVAENALSHLILDDDVALVVAAVSPAEAKVLQPWADRLLIPLLLVTSDESVGSGSTYTFRVYPSEKAIAAQLAQAAALRHLKKVAFLRPNRNGVDRLAPLLRDALKAQDIDVTTDVLYRPGDFASMESSGRVLFKLDENQRQDEYNAMIRDAQQKAKAAGVPFNPRSVILKPIVDVDALFIPDDFRTVRHFVKIFKYLGVDKLLLFGNYEWRSPSLIDPPEPFLDGAFFADFIGSYDNMPAGLTVPTMGSPLFAQPDAVTGVDFELIGYRAANIAQSVLRSPQETRLKRRLIPTYLVGAQTGASGFFTGMSAFDKDHDSPWPAFLFTVGPQGLSLATPKAP